MENIKRFSYAPQGNHCLSDIEGNENVDPPTRVRDQFSETTASIRYIKHFG